MTERKEPFEAGRDAIRNLAEKFAEPTEAEIAAAFEIAGEIETRGTTAQSNAAIISRHNAPLHAKLAAQKAALQLAQKAIEAQKEWIYATGIGDKGQAEGQYYCFCCSHNHSIGHSPNCPRVLALAKIKEALQ